MNIDEALKIATQGGYAQPVAQAVIGTLVREVWRLKERDEMLDDILDVLDVPQKSWFSGYNAVAELLDAREQYNE